MSVTAPDAPTKSVHADTISTNDWDLVYAAYFPAFNANIKSVIDQDDKNKVTDDKRAFPNKFSVSGKGGLSGGYSFAGTFGYWRLTTQGSGKSICLAVDVKDAAFTNSLVANASTGPFTAIVQLQMDWVEDSKTYYLKTQGTAGKQSGTVVVTQPVEVMQLLWPNRQAPSWLGGNSEDIEDSANMLKGHLTEYFFKIPDAIKHGFSSAILNQIATRNGTQWVKPTYISYAVSDTDNADIDKSVFGILCMTENRDGSGNSPVVDVKSIPDGADAAMVLSPQLILRNILLPGLKYMFADATENDFFIQGKAITNKTDLTVLKQLDHKNNVIQPKVSAQNFTIELENGDIAMKFLGMTWEDPEHEGLVYKLDHASRAHLNVNSKGQLQLCVDPALNGYENSMNATYDPNMLAMAVVLSIVTSVVAAIGGGFAGAFIGNAVRGASTGAIDATVAAATEATAEVATSVVSEEVAALAGDSITNLSEDSFEEAGEEMEAVENNTEIPPGRLNNIKTYFVRNWPKMLGAAVGGLAGTPVGMWPQFLLKTANDNDAPTLDKFGQEVLSAAQIANLLPSQFSIVGGTLNESFSVGFKINNNS